VAPRSATPLSFLIIPANSEGTTGRALTGPNYASGDAMTIQSCINFCDAQGAIYAGVEYSVRVNPADLLRLALAFAIIDSLMFFPFFRIINRLNAVSLIFILCSSYPLTTANNTVCGNSLSNGGGLTAPTGECNMRCSGNTAQPCGGPGRLNLFWSGAEPPAPPSTAPQIGDWESLGCYRYVCILACHEPDDGQ
jgi:hypothetical protein